MRYRPRLIQGLVAKTSDERVAAGVADLLAVLCEQRDVAVGAGYDAFETEAEEYVDADAP